MGLINKLHPSGPGAYIDNDHILFWSWIDLLFTVPEVLQKAYIGNDIINHLSSIIFPLTRISHFEIPIGYKNPQTINDRILYRLSSSRWDGLRFLCYPLIEAALKRACTDYFDQNGNVIKKFRRGKNNNQYNKGEYCSSLYDLLNLLENNVAKGELKYFLLKIKEHIIRFAKTTDPYKTLFKWRNENLHGNNFNGITGALFLHISILILLEVCRDDYENFRKKALEIFINKTGGKAKFYTP